MTEHTWIITVTVGPVDQYAEGGFVDYLLGEINNAVESTDADGIPVQIDAREKT